MTIALVPPSNLYTTQCHAPSVFVDQSRRDKIQAILPEIDLLYEEFAEAKHCPGYAYGIVLDGELIHVSCGGYSDLEQKIPVTSHTMFRIASMTKSFTAMAVAILRDEGKLRLDDPVSSYIPALGNRHLTSDSPEITIRDLLTHSAGFPSDNPWGDRKLDEQSQDLIALLEEGLFFSNAPGIQYEYSNLGYTLLGYIIQVVSGQPYDLFIRERILKPIGMGEVAWDFNDVSPSQLALGYGWDGKSWQPQEILGHGIYGAMGGMIASLDSYSRYIALHLSAWPPRDDAESPPIKRSSTREMHQLWRFAELTEIRYLDGTVAPLIKGYGYGLNVSRDSLGKVFAGHSGGLPGFGSNWTILPEYGLGIIHFANVTYGGAAALNLHILHKLVIDAQLTKRQLSPSDALQERQNELIKLLPDWEEALENDLFAKNFFLDRSIDLLEAESRELFSRSGEILSIGAVMPENQLRGSFVLECENCNLRITFGLTPENPPRIQELHLSNEN
jgi:CubicO group peptidase (beta-lactamase class C family)